MKYKVGDKVDYVYFNYNFEQVINSGIIRSISNHQDPFGWFPDKTLYIINDEINDFLIIEDQITGVCNEV
jgi:hypothetical protein